MYILYIVYGVYLWYNKDNEKCAFLQKATKKGGENMPIKYDKLIKLMKEKGLTTYKIRQEKIISQSALTALKNGKTVTTDTIAKLCEALGCQPGDIMEYVKE